MDGRDIEELLGFAKPEGEKPADAGADGESAGAETAQDATDEKTESAK